MKGIADWNDTSMTAGLAASRVPVLVQFTARWCPPCNAMKPGVDAIARKVGASSAGALEAWVASSL
jgi:thiol-disulfide isomerase/thioredoxin